VHEKKHFRLAAKVLNNYIKQHQINLIMSSVNKVILIGNVGADPEVRYLDRGVAIANFNLATTERGYVMQNGTQVPDVTEWHSIVLWRNLAEWAQQNVRKSMKLYVEGKLKTRAWEKDGQIRRKTEVIAENVQILYRPEQYRNQNAEAGRQDAEALNDAPEALNDAPAEEKSGFFNDIF
jgi:single-strand DNA-binding protein